MVSPGRLPCTISPTAEPPRSPPTSCVPARNTNPDGEMPGSKTAIPFSVRLDGTTSITSCLRTVSLLALCRSTIGVPLETVMVSSTPPTSNCALTCAVNVPSNSIPVRSTVLNPGSVNLTVKVPGRRSTMRYCPLPSVSAVRTFSISAGLDASTVTPGSTAPDPSLTVPLIDACAKTAVGRQSIASTTTAHTPENRILVTLRLECLSSCRTVYLVTFSAPPLPSATPGTRPHRNNAHPSQRPR